MKKFDLGRGAVIAAAVAAALCSGARAQDEEDPFKGPGAQTPAGGAPGAPRQHQLPRMRLRGYAEVKGGPAAAFLDVDAEKHLVRAGESFLARIGESDATFEVVSVADGAVSLKVREDGRQVVVR